MKKKIIVLTILCVIYANLTNCSIGTLSQFLKLDNIEEDSSFTSLLTKQLNLLQEDKGRIEENLANTKANLEAISSEISSLKEKVKIAKGAEREFSNQKLLILNQQYQVLSEIEQVSQHVISLIDNHSKLLSEYKTDPEFKTKNLRRPQKSVYTLKDLLDVYDMMVQYEAELKDLEDRAKKIVNNDLANRQKAQTFARQEFNAKKKSQEDFAAPGSENEEETNPDKLSMAQKGELIDEEVKLYKYKKDLADIRVKETEQKRNFLIDFQMKTTRIQLNILKDEYERIKRLFQVDENFKKQTEENLELARQESDLKQKKYRETVEGLDKAKEVLEEELSAVRQQFGIRASDILEISQWNLQPASVVDWGSLIAVHKILHKISLAQINRDQLLAQTEQEKAKLLQQEILTQIITTWYKLTNTREEFSQEDISNLIKQFEALKVDVQAANTFISEKRAVAGANLNNNTKLLDNINSRVKELKEQKDTVFKNHTTEYTHYFSRLKDAEDDIRSRGEPLARIIEIYAQIQEVQTKTVQKIDGILAELQSRLTGKRAPGALWKSLQDFMPDIGRFIKDTRILWGNYYNNLQLQSFSKLINHYPARTYGLFALLLVILILIYLLIKAYLPDFISFVSTMRPIYGFSNVLIGFISVVLNFLNKHLLGLYIWLIMYFALHYYYIKDPAIRIGLYLLSIPYMLFYAYKFIQYIGEANSKPETTFLSKSYQRRFIAVLAFLIYSSIIILFFREAFLVGNYHKSNVAKMLLVLNFIILQISLICLIGKEQILNIIPKATELGQLIYEYVSKFYYLFLAVIIFIIFMSNPYVGYGPQFFNVVSRVVIILLLIPLFTALHNKIKRSSFQFFFKTDGEVIKERFYYGKTSYGIFVILSFLLAVGISFIIAANIWGYSIGYKDIYDWFHKELYSAGLDATGHERKIIPLDYLKVVLYIFGAAIAVFIINRFFLRRIFDLLLVNVGVQNALLSLTRYTIIVTTLVLAIKSVGLGSAIVYIAVLITGLGFALKDLITDFIAYFIILIQRPIKIGDFVMLDEDTRGVVRHISWRTFFVRRKNSVTVIVPNSYLLLRPVVNWNYSRTFFAFDDIIIVVPFSSDPAQVKELLLKALENNINLLKNPPPVVQLQNFADNGFQFMVRANKSPDRVLDQFEIASDVRLELVRILRANNIDVAWPIRTIKLVSQNPSDFKTVVDDNQ